LLRVGLTGGFASGKSTVGQILRELGAAVFDADEIVARLYAPGMGGSTAVAQRFGPAFLLPDGSVDRTRLSGEVFGNAAARKTLEGAIHPLVVDEIRRRFDSEKNRGARVAVAEASQIFEAGSEREFDRVAVVVSAEELRRRRGREKGFSAEELARRMAAQMDPSDARLRADDVLENSGTVEQLRTAVGELYLRWLGAAP
jgi:dephospho-CoA kinase